MGSGLCLDLNVESKNISKSIENKNFDEWKYLLKNLTENTALNDYVLSSSRKKLNTISKLKKFLLKSPVKNDTERLWSAFLWITHNIDYDFCGLKNDTCGDQDADSVLKSGVSICAGYSNLFSLLCDSFNIRRVSILGYSKGYGYNIGKTKFTQIDHDWNAVFIDDKWQLIESTWGAGFGNDDEGYVRRFQPYWFFTPPEIFIFEHFPEDEKFQFLSKSLSLLDFEMLPNLKIEFFINKIKCLSHSKGVVNDKDIIVFEAPKDKQFSATLVSIEHDSDEIKNSIFLQRDFRTNNFIIEISPLQSINHKLSIFCGNTGGKEHQWIGDFLVKPINDAGKTFEKFCKKFSFPQYIFLFEPKEMHLKLNSMYLFKVYLAKTPFHLVLYDSKNKLTYFEKDKTAENVWILNYTTNSKGSLFISILRKEKQLSTAFEYEVI